MNRDTQEKELHESAQWRFPLFCAPTRDNHEPTPLATKEAPTSESHKPPPPKFVESDLDDNSIGLEDESDPDDDDEEVMDENIIINSKDLKLTIEKNLVCAKCRGANKTKRHEKYFHFADSERSKMLNNILDLVETTTNRLSLIKRMVESEEYSSNYLWNRFSNSGLARADQHNEEITIV